VFTACGAVGEKPTAISQSSNVTEWVTVLHEHPLVAFAALTRCADQGAQCFSDTGAGEKAAQRGYQVPVRDAMGVEKLSEPDERQHHGRQQYDRGWEGFECEHGRYPSAACSQAAEPAVSTIPAAVLL
jgi:hypothetical protein